MSAKIRFLAAGIVALGVTACATHPLPEDVTGENTVRILRKIRCEAKDALDEITGEYLIQHATNDFTIILGNQIKTHEVRGDDLWNNRDYYIPKIKLTPEGLRLFQTFTRSAVTFDFLFQISEENNPSAGAEFSVPLANGSFNLPLNSSAALKRQNERKFLHTESFFELHTIPRSQCEGLTAKVANMFYPIVGQIGLWEVFHSFIEINRYKRETQVVTKDPDPPTWDHSDFSDRLTFTTNLSGDIGPKLTANPVGGRTFQLASASAKLEVKRSDVHEVTIALARGRFIKSFATERPDSLPLVNPASPGDMRSINSAKARSHQLALSRRLETGLEGLKRLNEILLRNGGL